MEIYSQRDTPPGVLSFFSPASFLLTGKRRGPGNGRFLAAKATRQDEKTGVRSKNSMPDQAKHISSGFDAALYGLRNDVFNDGQPHRPDFSDSI